MKALAAASAALLLAASNSAPQLVSADYNHNPAAIVRIECRWADGGSIGTAVKIGRDSYITAAHVVDKGACQIGGAPIAVTWMGRPQIDFATLTGPASDTAMPVSCGGYRAGHIYAARGYAFGGHDLFLQPWLATTIPWANGLSVFLGEAYAGMSGGPLIDRQGRVRGIVNTRMPSMSLSLAVTPVCA